MSKLKIVVLGASGFLGSVIYKTLSCNFEVIGTTTSLRNSDSSLIEFRYLGVQGLRSMILAYKPDVIINCIALTDVNESERNPSLSEELNHRLVFNLAQLCQSYAVRLIHISTDHFESNFYGLTEDEQPVPVNTYGKTKLKGDFAALQNAENCLILRTNFFGVDLRKEKHGLLHFVEDALKRGVSVVGYKNIYFNPVSMRFLVGAISKILNSEVTGILNIASPQVLSKFEFCRLVARELGFDPNFVIPGDFQKSTDVVSRPRCMALNPTKFLELTGEKIPSILEQIKLELSVL